MHGKNDVANRNARQATKEQIRLAEITQSESYDEDRSRIQKYIKEIVETTRCSPSQAEIALHDAGNNVEAAVNQILESTNPETWTHYKRKNPKNKDAQEQEEAFKKNASRPARRGPFNANSKPGGGNFQPRDGHRGGEQRDGRENRQPRNQEGGFRGRDHNARPPRREFNAKSENNGWNTAKPGAENEDDGDDIWGTGKSLVFSRRENVEEAAPQPAATPVEQPQKSTAGKPCAAGPLSFADVVRKNAQKSAQPPPPVEPVPVPNEPRNAVPHGNSQLADPQQRLTSSPAQADESRQSSVLLEAEHRDEKAHSPLSSHALSGEDQMQQSLTDKLKSDLGLSGSTATILSPPKSLHESQFSQQSAVNAGVVEFVSGDLPVVSADFQFGFDAGPSTTQQHSLMDERFHLQNEQMAKMPEPSRPESVALSSAVPENAGQRANAVLNQYVQSQQHAAQAPQQHLSYSHQQQQANQYNRNRNGANNPSSSFNDNYPVNFQSETRNTYGAPPSSPKAQNIPQGLQSQQSSQQAQMAQSQAQQPPHHPQHMYQPTQIPYNFPYMYSPVPQPGMREDFTSLLPYQFNLNQMDLNPLTMTQMAVTSAGPIPGHQQHHQNSHQQQNLGQHTQNAHTAQPHQRDSTWLNSQLPPASQNSQPNGHGSQSNANMNSSQQRQSMVDNNSQNMLGNAIQPPPGFAPSMAAAPFRAPVFTAYHAPPPYMQFPYVIPQTHNNKSKP